MWIVMFNTHINPPSSVLQTRRVRLRGVKPLAQGPTPRTKQSKDLNLSSHISDLNYYYVNYYSILSHFQKTILSHPDVLSL